ncbi:MAG: transposase, partial [Chlamydiota bacterium]|nr:transposase [Chlamydiota bacterium]
MERHSVVVGKKNRGWQAVDEVLLLFNHREKKAIKGYQEFIRDGMNMGQRDDLIGGGLIRSAGGWEGVQ